MDNPTGVAVDALTGDLYIAGSTNNRVRMVSKLTGFITTVAGNGMRGYSGDGGPATLAQLYSPVGVAVDSSRRLIYIVDALNNAIRMINMENGNITTVAGGINDAAESNGDEGRATLATLSFPTRNVVDLMSGNIYIAETGRNCVRMVTHATGIITTFAGNGLYGSSGDGGQATSASLGNPTGLALDPASGDLYIADTANSCIRMVKKSTKIITTVAGNGQFGYTGDGGPAVGATLFTPLGLSVSPSSQNLYIVDTDNNCIRMVTLSTGIINTVAGTGIDGYSGDGGQAIYAMLHRPYSITTDPRSGMIYIADGSNSVVRSMNGTMTGSVRPTGAPTPYVAPAPSMPAPSVNPANLGESARWLMRVSALY